MRWSGVGVAAAGESHREGVDGMQKTSDWTLYLDESGSFEGDKVDKGELEPLGLVVGGVLCAGAPESHDGFAEEIRRACRAVTSDWPPHATALSDTLPALRRFDEACARLYGRWVFV